MAKKFNKWLVLILAVGLIQTAKLHAQLRVAVGDFENQTHDLLLDGWARNLPDYLSSELSQSKDLVLVERNRLNEIMKEFHLALSGLLSDSAKVEQVGKLAGADVLISGIITKIEGRYVILAHLTRVKNGEVLVERVEAPDRRHFKEMVQLLANNVKFRLTGWGTYKSKQTISSYPTLYFLGASFAVAVTATVLNNQFSRAHVAYEDAEQLDKIDPNYNKANRYYKWRNVAWTVAGGCLLGAVVSFVHNRFNPSIQAGSGKEPGMSWQPLMEKNGKGVRIGLSFRF